MTIKAQTGVPVFEGSYVAEVYYGWRILEWKDGKWHFDIVGALWKAGDPVQWVGPLPDRTGGSLPPPILGQNSPMEFDL